MRKVLVSLLTVMAICTLAWAGPVTLNFGEIPNQPVNGLTYMGVTFGFTVGGSPSDDARYNSLGPGTLTYVQDPSLEGDSAGILRLDFAWPTPILSFGVALSMGGSLSPGFTAVLYDSGLNLIGTYPVNTVQLMAFTEGWFDYGGTPVSRASISFSPGSRFAFDNLTYAPIPEPGTWALFGLGLLGIALLRRRRA